MFSSKHFSARPCSDIPAYSRGPSPRLRILPAVEKSKTPERCSGVFVFCSAGRIRTYNQLVNSELRYHCATAECARDYSGNTPYFQRSNSGHRHDRNTSFDGDTYSTYNIYSTHRVKETSASGDANDITERPSACRRRRRDHDTGSCMDCAPKHANRTSRAR